MSALFRIVSLALIGALLVACSSDDDGSATDPVGAESPPETNGDPNGDTNGSESPPATGVPGISPVSTHSGDSLGMDALLTGELTLTAGCLTVVVEDGSATIPVFPRGTAHWNDDLLVVGAAEYAPGDEVAFGGGFGDPDVQINVPPTCESAELFWVNP
ncbi:hypothetical protein [Nocardioides limicola]|uniref:hypothetical protein n=1 Tax=Nocardioides limicola TaxID=2803368 RepID=UPI00193BA3B7|nr:hypothetical protein [Nocardioides sp. DJM-14]